MCEVGLVDCCRCGEGCGAAGSRVVVGCEGTGSWFGVWTAGEDGSAVDWGCDCDSCCDCVCVCVGAGAECDVVEVPVEIVVEPLELFEVGSVLLVVLTAGGVYVVEPECDDGCE